MTKKKPKSTLPTSQFRPFVSLLESTERNALCQRLGINFERAGDLTVWAAIGMALAAEQPEFGGEKNPGRPRLKGGGVDYARALAVRSLRRSLEAGDPKTILTKKSLIERLSNEGHGLFVNCIMQSLAVSVSRGNTEIEERERKLIRDWARGLRQFCEHFRERWDWKNSAESADARLEELYRSPEVWGLLSPQRTEVAQLVSRLRNPFHRLLS